MAEHNTTIVRDKYHGTFGINDGIVTRLTECCEATGKGVMDADDEPMVACRKCLMRVEDVYGIGADSNSEDYLQHLRVLLKPCASKDDQWVCVAEVRHAITEALT